MKTLSYFLLFFFSSTVFAEFNCTVENTKITRLYQWEDGSIFMEFEKFTNCKCPDSYRMGFHKDDNEKFIMSAAIVAFTTGKTVTANGDDTGCVIHNNTAKLKTFTVNR